METTPYTHILYRKWNRDIIIELTTLTPTRNSISPKNANRARFLISVTPLGTIGVSVKTPTAIFKQP